MSGIIYGNGAFFQELHDMRCPIVDFITPTNSDARIREIFAFLLTHPDQEAAAPLMTICLTRLGLAQERPQISSVATQYQPESSVAEPLPLSLALQRCERTARRLETHIHPRYLANFTQEVQSIRAMLTTEQDLIQRCDLLLSLAAAHKESAMALWRAEPLPVRSPTTFVPPPARAASPAPSDEFLMVEIQPPSPQESLEDVELPSPPPQQCEQRPTTWLRTICKGAAQGVGALTKKVLK